MRQMEKLAEYRKAIPALPLLKEEKGRVKGFVSCGVLLPDYEAEIRNAAGRPP
jgi:hypothetical protein